LAARLAQEAEPSTGWREHAAAIAAAVLLVVALVFGGSTSSPLAMLTVRLASLVVAPLAVWRLAQRRLPARSQAALLLLAATIALPLLQLVPLPPDIWTRLPGRAVASQALRLAGVPAPWMPLSLTPEETWRCDLGLLPPAVMFCAVLGLNLDARRAIAWAPVLVCLVGVVLGVLQLSGGEDSPLRFYADTNADSAVGFFANRNHQAIMAVVSIVFAIVVVGARGWATGRSSLFWLATAGALVLVLLVGVAATRSRAGVSLAVVSTLGAAAILAAKRGGVGQTRLERLAPVLASLAAGGLAVSLVLAFSFTPLASRFQTGLNEDLRAQIAPKTVELASDYGPLGSGIGSFRTIYRTVERPQDVRVAYVNNAHDDFLELWLEAGWAGAALFLAFLIWLADASRGAFARANGGGLLVAVLLLAHSVVDYPLRTPALATLFAFACGLIAPTPAVSARQQAEGGSEARAGAVDAWRRGAGAVAAVAGAIVLGLTCVQQAFVDDQVANGHTAVALEVNPRDPQALAIEADDEAFQSPAELDHAAALARRALAISPLQTRALRVVAWQAEHEGRTDVARRLMEFAGGLTKRDVSTHWWLYFAAAGRGDYSTAFTESDVLLRQEPDLESTLRPSMLSMLDDPAAVGPLVSRLVYRPDWRSGFLADLAGHGTNIATVRSVFEALNASGAPLSQGEASSLINRMLADGAYQQALFQWRRFLPKAIRDSSVGLLFDPRFQGLPGPPPFNWKLVDEGGALSEIATTEDGGTALHLAYPAAEARLLADQLIVLPAGAYRLTGQVSFAQPTSEAQLEWRVGCVGGGAGLASARPDASAHGWSGFSLDLTVPPSCPAQDLRLSSLARDSFEHSEAWVRNLALVPVAAGSGAQPVRSATAVLTAGRARAVRQPG